MQVGLGCYAFPTLYLDIEHLDGEANSVYLDIELLDPKGNPMSAALLTHLDITIDRPADAVWSVVADYSRDRQWRRRIVEMTPDRAGPPAVGTRVREVLRLGGQEHVTDSVVVATGPGRAYRFSGTGTDGRVVGGRSVQPVGDHASVFRYDVQVAAPNLPRVLRPVMRRWLTHSLRRDLRRLRRMLEAAP
jgi:hypothetical protein